MRVNEGHMDFETNLLYSLLAFQKGWIDADRLLETCRETAAEATVSLPDQLVERGWLTLEQKAELDVTLDQELEHHGGDLLAALSATVDGRSLEAIREAPEVSGLIEARLTVACGPAGRILLESLLPGEAGSRDRYTLTHLYAKGGMGQVWLARDVTLGREIALKELRPDQANHALVHSRFLGEAKITAQLEHPGIVPVYELGEGQSPFYTMRFVKGQTLSQAIRSYHQKRAQADPVGLVNLLSAFIAVCHTVAYAHSRGVIHRDLKGQNVILGAFGEVIVLDWGLAKKLGSAAALAPADDIEPRRVDPTASPVEVCAQSAPGGTEAASEPSMFLEKTKDGQLLGTPAYMAPEQAKGQHEQTDHRTDVYGLGAILYEILTGRTPFQGKTTTELLRQVREELPKPPRLLNPQVAPDLQAICLKALAKAPGQRYGSATELAQEVQRHLADEPVLAYPEPWTRRTARWMRRHRTAVATAAGLMVTATALLSVSTVLISRERNEARAQGKQARQAVDDMYTRVAENWLEDRLDPLQKEFLEKALNYFETFTRESAREPAVRLEHGRIYQRMGDIQQKFGRTEAAEAAFRKAITFYELLELESPADHDVRRALAVTQTRLGELLLRHNQIEAAEQLFQQAESRLTALAANPDATATDLWLLARTLRARGELLRRRGNIVEARPFELRACDLLETAHNATPDAPEIRNDLALAYDSLGRLLREFGETDASERAFRRAYDLLDQLVASFPTMPRYRESLFHACNGLGGVEYATGRWSAAETHWRRQFREAERLAQDFPDRPEFQRFLAGGSANLGGILAEQNRLDEAQPILHRAIELNTALAGRFPEDEELRFDLANCSYNLGYVQQKIGRAYEAVPSVEKALELNRALIRSSPQVPLYRRALGLSLRLQGDVLQQLGRTGAEEAYRECLAVTEKLAAEFPANITYRVDLARCQNRLGGLLADAQRIDEAEAMYQDALAALDLKGAENQTRESRREQAKVLNNLGELRRSTHRPGAEESLRRAVAMAQELTSGPEPPRSDQQFQAIVQNNLGELLAEQQDFLRAEELFQTAIASLETLEAEAPTAVDTQSYLGHVADQQGRMMMQLGRLVEAQTAFEKAVNHQRRAVQLTEGKVPAFREQLASSLAELAETRCALGRYEDAIQAAVELSRTPPRPGQGALDAARILARCGAQVAADENLPADRRDQLSQVCLGRSVVLLREAIDANAKLVDPIRTDSDLRKILDRPEFQSLFSTVAARQSGSAE